MLRKIEYLLPAAMNAVSATLANSSGLVESGYQSALSGFGVSIMQMGLLPTFAVYNDKGSDADIDREKLLSAIQHVLASTQSKYPRKANFQTSSLMQEALSIHTNKPALRELKKHSLFAATALKLAIRTFKLV
jgi:hypothetical protein